MSSSASPAPRTREAFSSAAVGLVLVAAMVVVVAVARPSLTSALTSDTGVDESDGILPAGVTVFDDRYAGVAHLAPALRRALRAAGTAAGSEGVELQVNSGWRSPAYQEELLSEAVSAYGSEDEAARWVATADTSPHVHGDAVDIGPARAAAWLSRHGAAYGLCRVYRNEPWHFELRRSATDHGCPPPYADPTHDPRMKR